MVSAAWPGAASAPGQQECGRLLTSGAPAGRLLKTERMAWRLAGLDGLRLRDDLPHQDGLVDWSGTMEAPLLYDLAAS